MDLMQAIFVNVLMLWAFSSFVMLKFHGYEYNPKEQKAILGKELTRRDWRRVHRIMRIFKWTPLSILMLYWFCKAQYKKIQEERKEGEQR